MGGIFPGFENAFSAAFATPARADDVSADDVWMLARPPSIPATQVSNAAAARLSFGPRPGIQPNAVAAPSTSVCNLLRMNVTASTVHFLMSRHACAVRFERSS